ncbi:hypothetical protein HNO52_18145 [Billgrantia diversa]|uniref:hypothetical protein n=1 Tax=Halomonas sp. MCCC 1A13316 TaxID=2733487 RepID=UPI0018A46B28|nr:hypothetical protein [Halomonas sp. MCCC 1A13316]QOR40226.1 hypothetical protein HNO52_18145 [Halomonas sp. MCCC 1A13316]
MSDIQAFEEALLSHRSDFIVKHNREVDKAKEQFGARQVSQKKLSPLPHQANFSTRQKPTETKGVAYKTGYIIRLVVRKKKVSMLDEIFEFESSKISELEARLDAEKAAKAAGYPIIAYTQSITKL